MNKQKLFFWMGIFLVIDAVLSLYWGNFQLQRFIDGFGTMNNSFLGNLVRIVRLIIGGTLVFYNRK